MKNVSLDVNSGCSDRHKNCRLYTLHMYLVYPINSTQTCTQVHISILHIEQFCYAELRTVRSFCHRRRRRRHSHRSHWRARVELRIEVVRYRRRGRAASRGHKTAKRCTTTTPQLGGCTAARSIVFWRAAPRGERRRRRTRTHVS